MDIGMGTPRLESGYRYLRKADLEAADPSALTAVLAEAEATLTNLAQVFFTNPPRPGAASEAPHFEARYQALLEQIPAVVFMAFLDGGGISEAYVSPQIETMLGFAPRQWLDDPVLWYTQIHPGDKERWNSEAVTTTPFRKPLRSVCQVLAR